MTEHQARIAACARRGLTQAETARELGLSNGSVSVVKKALGLSFVHKGRGRRAAKPYDERIKACAARGLTQAETARELGIDSGCVSKVARRLGLEFAYRGRGFPAGSRKRAVEAPSPVTAPSDAATAEPVACRSMPRGLASVLHPRWSPADDLLLLRDRAAGACFTGIASGMDRGICEVQQRWHRLRAVPGIEALIEAHLEAGADADAPWPDPSEVAA
jgi:DNA-binding CsgD family transcriptional regulator